MSYAAQHARRVKRLTDGVRQFAADSGLSLSTASMKVMNGSRELYRLEDGGTTKPETLEKYERRLRLWKAGVNPDRYPACAA